MKTHSQNFLFEKDLQWENPGPGITRQIMGYDGQIMMVKVVFEEGAIGAPHKHFHSQVTYVASGEFEFTVGNETHLVKAGDSLYKEPNIPHGCICKKAGMLIDVFSPSRQDFLK
ncbi:MAG: cupin domain-containing protein [Bacteroidales bacterium]|jgi:quercetin dioxygenase-like cupin family protein|nr:cupin domain-containing protein [Bacteroidales bacterium]